MERMPDIGSARYENLSSSDRLREYHRDMLLWEQTEELKRANDIKEYGHSSSYGSSEEYIDTTKGDKLLMLWCLYFFGVIIYGAINISTSGSVNNLVINLGMSIVPTMLIALMLSDIINKINYKRNKPTKREVRKSEKIKRLRGQRLVLFTPEERYYIANDKAINALVNEFIEESNNTSKYDNVRDYNNKMLEIKKIIKTTKELGFMDTDK